LLWTLWGVIIGVVGCDDKKAPTDVEIKPRPIPLEQPSQKRFVIESQGSVEAGYNNCVREVLIITDTKTGRTYLAVTDCGITSLQEDQNKAASDVADGLSGMLGD
jgi:hypothetical protein